MRCTARRDSHRNGHWAMMRNRMPAFSEIDRVSMTSRDVVEAWIVIALLLCATLVGVILDQAAVAP